MPGTSNDRVSQTLAPHLELSLLLARTPLPPEDSERAVRLVSGDIDWDAFFTQITSWQIEPVALANLLVLRDEKLPEAIIEKASKLSRETRVIGLSRIHATNSLLVRLSDAGISAIVLKGEATGVTAYGDASLRNFGDVDLLVRREDLLAARDLLLAEGWSPGYDLARQVSLIAAGHALEFSAQSTKVELHWSLLSSYLRLEFDTDEVWSSSKTVSCAGATIRVLDPATDFLFLCAHGTKHQWSSFRWICDIAQLLAQQSVAESEQVVALASRLHAKKILSLALELAVSTFGLRLPSSLEKVRHEHRTTDTVRNVLSGFGIVQETVSLPSRLERLHPALPQLLFWTRTRERFVDRIGSAADLALGALPLR